MSHKTVSCSLMGKVLTYGRMIKFSHTVFALPFALSAAVLAVRDAGIDVSDLIWILTAMVGARSAAMGYNRIIDADIDAGNPRTCQREIPAGKLPLSAAWAFVIASSMLFVFSAAMLGTACLILSIPVLLVLFGYSHTKRFTWLCHLYLGFAISLAPLGAWIALTGRFSWSILLLSSALMSYIAGFDILYACQDLDVDRRDGLCSMPVFFGPRTALRISGGLHVITFISLGLMYVAFDMHGIYLATVILIGGLLAVEQKLVNPDDFSRINIAFFNVNSIISVLLFAGILADELVRRWV